MSPLEYCLQKAGEIPYVKGQQRHYSVILCKRGRIISEAANSYTKTSTVMAKAAKRLKLDSKTFCHSEQLALVRSKGKGYKLVVARVLADGSKANSQPCPICALLIRESQIEIVEYSA